MRKIIVHKELNNFIYVKLLLNIFGGILEFLNILNDKT